MRLYSYQETNENYNFVYKNVFDVLDASLVKIIMVDKDLQNLDLVRDAIPTADLLICTFHVLKYLRTRIVALDAPKVVKLEMKQLVNQMVYCDMGEYEELLEKIRPMHAESKKA